MNGGLVSSQSETSIVNTTVTNKLKQEKERLEKRLNDINNALKTFEKYPEVAETLDAVSKLHL